MKKSILALSAAAVVGGLGLATSAQALVFFNNYGPNTNVHGLSAAQSLELNPGGTGHELIVPYYSAQPGTATSISIVNTDGTNGKAVKVRFRGAANSDDVLDFTLFLSPSDVWTATISAGPDGTAQLSTADNSCSLPADIKGQSPVSFSGDRFPAYMTSDQVAANTREGYIEILNEADIPPTNSASGLFTAIKHVNGVPPCTQGPIFNLQDHVTTETSANLLNDYGLESPTGGLFGSWSVVNQNNFAQFSGGDTAIRAVAQNELWSTTQGAFIPGVPGYTYVAFSPQDDLSYEAYTTVASPISQVTADPLLTQLANGNSAVTPLRFDVPDLSTPLLPRSVGNPTHQAYMLSTALGHVSISNEFANDPTGAASGVPFSTDWVVSQPTRRYFAVVDYAGSAAAANIVYNNNAQANAAGDLALPTDLGNTGLPYWNVSGATNPTPTNVTGVLQLVQTSTGPVASLPGSFQLYDREEGTNSNAVFSPRTGSIYKGEVATLTFGNSPLNASLTNTKTTGAPAFGWATFTPSIGTGGFIPMTGFAALTGVNASTGSAVGMTLPHRWGAIGNITNGAVQY